MKRIVYIFLISFFIAPVSMAMKSGKKDSIIVVKTEDFEVKGDGSSVFWDNASWNDIPEKVKSEDQLKTKFKVLYSTTGIYFFIYCEDSRIDATYDQDYESLWLEDVVEVFLWPDQSKKVYFEYELSPLNYELPLLIMNIDGDLNKWQPWNYKDTGKILHQTGVKGGQKKSGASIKSWTAEFYIPFSLLEPMQNVPPSSGTQWRSNLYRMDYLNGIDRSWAWQKVERSFHNLNEYGTLVFE